MNLTDVFKLFGIVLGLGLLVGLQRESKAMSLAGVRIFPLITIWGNYIGIASSKFRRLYLRV